MASDASIYGQLQQPRQVNLLADALQGAQLGNALQDNRLAALQMQEYQRARQEDDLARQTYAQFGSDTSANTNALLRAGLGKQAFAYQKQVADNAKSTADAQQTQIENEAKKWNLRGQAFGFVKDNPTAENLGAAISNLRGANLIDDTQIQRLQGMLGQDQSPQAIQRVATMLYQNALSAEKQLPTFQTRNTGGSTDTLSINPVTGKVTVANSVANTASPEALLSAETARRGQNMADSRAREGLAIQRDNAMNGRVPSGYRQGPNGTLEFIPGGPADPQNKAGGGKPLTEGQSKSLVFASRMQEAEDVFDKLSKVGVTKSVPGTTAPFIGGAITALAGPQNQQLSQAKRNWLTANLRRESGALIGEQELAEGDKQYFPQIGDSPEVIAQKRQNRITAQRGIAADVPDADNRINQVRGGGAPKASGGWSVTEVK